LAKPAPAPPERFLAWDPAAREYVVRVAVAPTPERVRREGVAADAALPQEVRGSRPGRVRAVSADDVEVAGYRAGIALGRGRKLRTGQRLYLEYSYSDRPTEAGAFAPAPDLDRATLRQNDRLSENRIELNLQNKLDNQWYRLSARIPRGYRVQRIVRDDGLEIVNRGWTRRDTGVVEDENVAWYLEGDTLVFYDDPVYGYSIYLYPPSPSASLLVEIASPGSNDDGGQISAICWPYDGGTPLTYTDHAGRTGDNTLASNFDNMAGSKLALRFTAGGTTVQYGNPGGINTGASGDFADLGHTYTTMNRTPGGTLESVIVTELEAPAGSPIPLAITQKIIIRGNMKWFATLYYIRNTSAVTNASNLRFFQGVDWNFNGDNAGDNCAYDSGDDLIYGYKPSGSPQSYGGFSGYEGSSQHEVERYTTMWQNMRDNNFSNGTAYSGDAGTALAWDRAGLPADATWTMPIIWAYGNTLSGTAYQDMADGIDYGKMLLHDTGVLEITEPAANQVFNPLVTPNVDLNATVALYGLQDFTGLPVHVSITSTAPGFTPVDMVFTTVNLSVPNAETAAVTYPFDISAVPSGVYTVKIYTRLGADTGYPDQAPLNDAKTVTFVVGDFSLEQSAAAMVAAGATSYYSITLTSNTITDRFNLPVSPSSQGWASRLLTPAGVTLAADTDGNGVWDAIASGSDTDADGLPDVLVTADTPLLLIFAKTVPRDANPGQTDTTTLTATQQGGSLTDAATLTTQTINPLAQPKTLYLHDATENFALYTTPETSPTGTYTTITRFDNRTWIMNPEMADDFRITGNISVPLVLTTNNRTLSATVTLFCSKGSEAYVVGESTLENIRITNTSPSTRTFVISVPTPVTVPAGFKLVLRFNHNRFDTTAGYFRVYHSSTQRSRIALSTPTYIRVDGISVFDAAGNTRSALEAIPAGAQGSFGARIADPLGAYDITGATLTIVDSAGTTRVNAAAMTLLATDTASPALWKWYRYPYTFPATPTGKWTAFITANESNGVVQTRLREFYIGAPNYVALFPDVSSQPVNMPRTLTAQVFDAFGNSLSSAQTFTLTATGAATFTSPSAGNPIVVTTGANGSVNVTLTDGTPQSVTVTPSHAWGVSANDKIALTTFRPPDHAVATAVDGSAVVGAGGPGETVTIQLYDALNTIVADSRAVTVTVSGSAYFAAVPAGWSGAGTSLAFGFTNAGGQAVLDVRDTVAQTVTVAPDSGLWGVHASDVSTTVVFVAGGADHVVVMDSIGTPVTAGNTRVLNIRIKDADGNNVSGAQTITLSAGGSAFFSVTSLSGAIGVGTATVTGTTAADGSATITVADQQAEQITVTPNSSSLPGSLASPDRDQSVQVLFIAGVPDHVAASPIMQYPLTGTPAMVDLQIVDRYGNVTTSAATLSVILNGSAILSIPRWLGRAGSTARVFPAGRIRTDGRK